jgi:hypothetical protein
VSDREPKPWESGAIPNTGEVSGPAPAAVQFDESRPDLAATPGTPVDQLPFDDVPVTGTLIEDEGSDPAPARAPAADETMLVQAVVEGEAIEGDSLPPDPPVDDDEEDDEELIQAALAEAAVEEAARAADDDIDDELIEQALAEAVLAENAPTEAPAAADASMEESWFAAGPAEAASQEGPSSEPVGPAEASPQEEPPPAAPPAPPVDATQMMEPLHEEELRQATMPETRAAEAPAAESAPASAALEVEQAPFEEEQIDLEVNFDEESIEYALSDAPPWEDGDPIPDDDPFEGSHTNVTNAKELQDWLAGGPPPPPPAPAPTPAAAKPAPAPKKKEAAKPFTVSGSLEAFQVVELLQLFASKRRTGALTLSNEGKRGRLFIENGDVYAATWNGKRSDDPTEALRRMGRMTQGLFAFGPLTAAPPKPNVTLPLPTLIIEMISGQEELALDAQVQLADPFPESLRSLSPEELDALGLMHNHKTLEAAIAAGQMDAEPLKEHVTTLIDRGFLTKLEFLDDDAAFLSGF